MPAAAVPEGVTRLRDPGLVRNQERWFTDADFVLAEIRHIVTAEFGGRDTPPDPEHWGVYSDARADELRKIAKEYVDAVAAALE